MKSYAHLLFVKHPVYKTQYVLAKQAGEVPGLDLCEYSENSMTKELQIVGMKYISFEVPRNPAIRKYFAHTFVMNNKQVLTSTEPLNEKNRTFGDTKKMGTTDLVLIQFSQDMKELEMWFVKDKGNNRQEKQEIFAQWNKTGE